MDDKTGVTGVTHSNMKSKFSIFIHALTERNIHQHQHWTRIHLNESSSVPKYREQKKIASSHYTNPILLSIHTPNTCNLSRNSNGSKNEIEKKSTKLTRHSQLAIETRLQKCSSTTRLQYMAHWHKATHIHIRRKKKYCHYRRIWALSTELEHHQHHQPRLKQSTHAVRLRAGANVQISNETRPAPHTEHWTHTVYFCSTYCDVLVYRARVCILYIASGALATRAHFNWMRYSQS